MFKNTLKFSIATFAAINLAVATPLLATPDYVNQSRSFTPMNQIVLEPNWRSSCSSNFVIENLSNKPAVVRITMGRDGTIQDTIPQWDKRGYDLRYRLSFAKQLGKTVDIDDVALIENMSPNSRVSVHC